MSRVEEARAAAPRQPLGLWWLAPVGLAVAGWLAVRQDLRSYGYAVAGLLVGLTLLRVVLPRRWAGGLAVRSRWLDGLVMLALGVGVAVVTATLRRT